MNTVYCTAIVRLVLVGRLCFAILMQEVSRTRLLCVCHPY